MLSLVLQGCVLTSPITAQDTPTPPPPPGSPSPAPNVEDRFRKLEAHIEELNRKHKEEIEALKSQYEALKKETGNGAQPNGMAAPLAPVGDSAVSHTQTTTDSPSLREDRGVGAQGTEARVFVREIVGNEKKPGASVKFDEGLEFSSSDDEMVLTFHNLTQAEYRAFSPNSLGTLHDQFFVPRQRWYFTGQASRNVEFYTVINRGYGSLDMLDAFVSLNILESFRDRSREGDTGASGAQGVEKRVTVNKGKGSDPRLRFRIGRMKTPYLYEYYSIAEGDLIAPERSLFAGNLAGNRMNGAMFLGNLLDDKVGYSFGVFNGGRRSFEDTNSSKDVFGYLNLRPFLDTTEFEALKYLNLGGSIFGGKENEAATPLAYRTANDDTNSSSAYTLSPTFLNYNPTAIERGQRLEYSAHLVWYYKSLMLMSEFGGGYNSLALATQKYNTQIPVGGWMIQASYFITGETLNRRVNVVHPLRNFGYRKGEFNPGAIEVFGRFSEMNVGRQVFSAGLANPNLWSNSAQTVDVGFNWYWNYYTKIYFDWQHAMYGSPVSTGNPGHPFMSTTDLYWFRVQLFL